MKTLLRLLAVFIALAGLAACKQVQLGGAVVAAEVRIELLNQPGASYQYALTTNTSHGIEQLGLQKWSQLSDTRKTFWLGTFEVNEALVDSLRLYLLTTSGGSDTDVNHDGKLDRQNTPVIGNWHAIMPGSALLSCCNQVSALTEAAYQYVRDRIGYVSDERLLALLDNFAALVVKDVNGDKQVNYADVLIWSRMLSATRYRGDITLLDKLADAVVRGEPDYVVRAAAESVVLNRPVEPAPPEPVNATTLGGTVKGNLVLTRAKSPYLVESRLNIEGNLLIEPGVTVGGGRFIGDIGIVSVTGNVAIEGLPRQRVVIKNLSLNVYSYGGGASNVIRNADITSTDMDFKIQRLLIEGSRLSTVSMWITNIVKSDDSHADIRQNIVDMSALSFINSGPIHPGFRISVENNFFVPNMSRMTTFNSQWDGPLQNLMMRNNTFHSNMRFLLGSPVAQMDISYNHWGPMGFPVEKLEEITPANKDLGPLGQPVIPFEPWLEVKHIDTPLPW